MKPVVMYIHGFGSMYDKNSSKIRELSKIGTVLGMTIDYTKHPADIEDDIHAFAIENKVDMLVGTSMGGYFANRVGSLHSIPFVMINPAIHPENTLMARVGKNRDYYGRDYHLEEQTVIAYITRGMYSTGHGLLLVDEGDELIDAAHTIEWLSPYFRYREFEGGSHRFEHMRDATANIDSHYVQSLCIGFGEN